MQVTPTGLATVSAGGTTVTGSGSIWSGTNVKPGDIFQIDNFQSVISDLTDTTHLVIPPWGGGAQTGVAYTIWQTSPQRFAGAQAMQTVSQLVAALNVSGFFWFVDTGLTEPDPSYGDDGQYAFQPTTGKTWAKVAGVWTYLGIFKAFRLLGAWSGATAYVIGDVVTLSGSSYVCILDHTNHTPPNTTYWQLLAGKGDTGAAGPTGPAGAGDVVGPSSATDNAAARFDATTGKLVQDSALLIADATGALSRSGNGGISVQGTNTNDSAASGYVGEYGSATVSVTPGVSFGATNTPVNLASVSLPAGDYDVWGNAVYVPGGSSVVTQCLFWISTTSVNNPGVDSGDSTGFGFGSGITGGAASHIAVVSKRISLAATTTVYLSGQVSFTGSVPSAGGTIKWRRRR